MQTKEDFEIGETWSRICEITLCNYINMEKRLSYRQKISEIVLIYYSIFLIIYSITPNYFPIYNSTLAQYFSVVFSIVLLAFSLVNGNAHYVRRISKVTDSINSLKTLKREIPKGDLKEFREKYNEITDSTELRSDIDFFRTVKKLCKEYGVKWYCNVDRIVLTNEYDYTIGKLKSYLIDINPHMTQFKIILMYFMDFFLILLPILSFILCWVY